MFGRKKIAMVVAEFLGTFILTSAVYAAATQGLPGLFVAMTAAVTLGLLVLTLGPTSGAHVNPAVTFGLWTLRKIETTTAIVYVAAQGLGATVAWRLNSYYLNTKLPNASVSKFDAHIFVAEMVGTLVFTFGIASAVYQGQKGLRLAVTIGASLGIGAMLASLASNGILNPAVAFGLRSWTFAYAVGPIAGSLIGMNLYAQLFAPQTTTKTVANVKVGKTTVKITKTKAKKRK